MDYKKLNLTFTEWLWFLSCGRSILNSFENKYLSKNFRLTTLFINASILSMKNTEYNNTITFKWKQL
jgi:hypothetical protein